MSADNGDTAAAAATAAASAATAMEGVADAAMGTAAEMPPAASPAGAHGDGNGTAATHVPTHALIASFSSVTAAVAAKADLERPLREGLVAEVLAVSYVVNQTLSDEVRSSAELSAP